jgi:DNA-binding CsgD family transcriptional regulator
MDVEAWTDGLIDRIYACMLGEEDWTGFLAAFGAPFPAAHATLSVHDLGLGRGHSAINHGFAPKAVDDYNSYYSRLNPWVTPLDAPALGQAHTTERMCPHRDLIRTEFYADFLRPQGIESGYRMNILSDGTTRMLLSVLHAGVPHELDGRVTAGMTRLYPHLRRVFEFARRSTLGESGFSGHRALVDALGIGVFYLSADRRVVYLNAKAKKLRDRNHGIGLDPTGRLTVADRDCMASIVDLLIWTRSWDRPIVRTATVHHDQRERPLQLVLLRPARSTAEAFFSGSLLIVFVSDPNDTHESRSDSVAKAYGLTRGERKLVEALAAGLRVKEVASRHDVSVETVRSQLRDVLGKMGLHGQADVVRTVLTSPMAYLGVAPEEATARTVPAGEDIR